MITRPNPRRIRRRPILGVLGAGMLAATFAPVAAAQDDAATHADVDRLLEELGRAREQMQSLQQEVGELRAASGDNWLTEERAGEIRSLIADVLADADSRASLLQNGMTAGWDENFFLASQDGRFALNIDGLAQIRWIYNWHDEGDRHRQGFENTRTRLTFRGHIFNRDLTYLVRADVTRNEPSLVNGLFFLSDAWVRYQLNNDWSVRFGQMKLPFNREELVSTAHQLTVERSLVNESLNLGRSQGIEATWAGEHYRFAAMVSDGAVDSLGGFGLIEPEGARINTPALTEDVEYSITARGEWKAAGTWGQFEDLTSPPLDPFGLLFGAAIHYQKSEFTGTSFSETRDEWFGYTLDASAEWGGANAFASFTHHMLDVPDVAGGIRPDIYGVVLQGGWYFTPKFEVFARYEWGQFIPHLSGTAFHTLNVASVGFNYYFFPANRHASKLTTDIGIGLTEVDGSWDSDIAGWRSDTAGNQNQIVFRMQYQLLF